MKFQLMLIFVLLVGCTPLNLYENPDSLSCNDLAKRFDAFSHDASLNKFPQGKPIYVGATLIDKSIVGDLGNLKWQGRNLISSFSVVGQMKAIVDIPLEQDQFYRFDVNRFILSGEHSGQYALDQQGFDAFEKIDCR